MKKVGVVGVGKIGYRTVEHLIEKNYVPVVFDLNLDNVKGLEKKGAISVSSIKELIDNLPMPRVILFLIPALGVDNLIEEFINYLSKNDIIIDFTNSFYKDSQRRAKYLKDKGVYFIDAGISGGISGARYGACIMIGGDKKAFGKVKHIFEDLSKNGSYKYLGKSGFGHLVKGYHNLVEYGYLQSLAEGLVCINEVSGKSIDLKEVCEIWSKGSIVESRITKDAENAFSRNLDGIKGSVYGQTHNEMEELVKIARGIGIEVPSCESAINARVKSQEKPTFAGKIINSIRSVFGGHEEWKD